MTASRLVMIALAGLLASTGVTVAQQPADPALLQKAIRAIQEQRNQAMDGQASASAQAAMLADELAKARAELEELKKKADSPKPQ